MIGVLYNLRMTEEDSIHTNEDHLRVIEDLVVVLIQITTINDMKNHITNDLILHVHHKTNPDQ